MYRAPIPSHCEAAIKTLQTYEKKIKAQRRFEKMLSLV
jgi:hypothetical protein